MLDEINILRREQLQAGAKDVCEVRHSARGVGLGVRQLHLAIHSDWRGDNLWGVLNDVGAEVSGGDDGGPLIVMR